MNTIRGRVVAAALLAVVAGALVALAITNRIYDQVLDSAISDTLVSAESSFEGLRNARVAVMHALLDATMKSESIQEAFEDQDREELQRISFPLFESYRETFGVTRWYYYDLQDDGCIFLRVYRGGEALDEDAYGDTSGSQALVRARETGEVSSGFEIGRHALSIRVIAPLVADDGQTLGYMGLGERVEDYLSVIADQTGDDYAMFLEKSLIEHEGWTALREQQGLPDNWDEYADVVLAESTLADDSVLEVIDTDALAAERTSLGTIMNGGRSLAVGTFPVLDVTGEAVGYVAVYRDVSELRATLRAAQISLVLTFIGVGLLLAIVLTLVLERVVFRRIAGMTSDLESMSLAVAAGEWDALERTAPSSEDEIGRFEQFFGSFLGLVAAALRSSSRRNDEGDAASDDR